VTTTGSSSGHFVVRNIERTPLELVDQFAPIGTATVHEAIGRRGYLGADITPIQSDTKIAGTAITVLCQPGHNVMIHAAVEMCQPGDVLVVANTGDSTHGMFGDLLATSLLRRGVRGLVIDAGVRDTVDLRGMGFPVWSRYVSCQGTGKEKPGSVNIAVTIGGATINPGDVVCCDDDGVVVVGREEAVWGLEKSNERLAEEELTRAKLEAGELGIDFYGLRQKIIDMGVSYVDSIDR